MLISNIDVVREPDDASNGEARAMEEQTGRDEERSEATEHDASEQRAASFR